MQKLSLSSDVIHRFIETLSYQCNSATFTGVELAKMLVILTELQWN